MLELTVRLGAPGLTMVPGIDFPHESHDESLARAAQELGRRAVEAREAGVRFSVEPHVGSVCGTPADVARLVELAPELELTLDYTHYVSQGFAEAELEPLLPHARHFHARGGAAGRVQCALKDSTIDYGRAVEALLATRLRRRARGRVRLDRLGALQRVRQRLGDDHPARPACARPIAGESWAYPVSST